jgi:hypothetical protein
MKHQQFSVVLITVLSLGDTLAQDKDIHSVGVAPDVRNTGQQVLQLVRDASYPEAFSYLGGVREMSDGRLMVADPLGQVLVLVDFTTETADTIGRVGSGPQEYQQPDAVFPLPGDSTLLVDLGNARLRVIAPDGTFRTTMPLTREGAGGAFTIVMPRFTDGSGRIYFQPESFTAGRPADSAAIARVNPTTGVIDTVAMVKLPEVNPSTSGRVIMLSAGPLRPQDGWAVGLDGRIAIARARDYSIEWIHPDGGVLHGPSNDYDPVRVGRAEKQRWLNGSSSTEVNVGMRRMADGTRHTRLSRGGATTSRRGIDSYDWPDVLPPFRFKRVFVSPDGDAWVERYVTAGAAPVIDVFDARGRKQGSITLPVDRRVVGFGRSVVYLARTDEFDLQWLERYRIN